MTDDELRMGVRSALAHRELMNVLRELLSRADSDALDCLRSEQKETEAVEIIRNNERFRAYFRLALNEGEKDPFNV